MSLYNDISQSASQTGVQRGIALRAAMAAAGQSSFSQNPKTTITFNTLMNLSVLRNQTSQVARSAPALLPLPQAAQLHHAVPPGESSPIENNITDQQPIHLSELANLVTISTQSGMGSSNIESTIAGPATQINVSAHDQDQSASEEKESIDDVNASTLLSKSIRTRNSQLTSESQRQRVTSPRTQMTTISAQLEAQRARSNNSFYGSANKVTKKRGSYPPPAPEKRKRERRSTKPPKIGLN